MLRTMSKTYWGTPWTRQTIVVTELYLCIHQLYCTLNFEHHCRIINYFPLFFVFFWEWLNHSQETDHRLLTGWSSSWWSGQTWPEYKRRIVQAPTLGAEWNACSRGSRALATPTSTTPCTPSASGLGHTICSTPCTRYWVPVTELTILSLLYSFEIVLHLAIKNAYSYTFALFNEHKKRI